MTPKGQSGDLPTDGAAARMDVLVLVTDQFNERQLMRGKISGLNTVSAHAGLTLNQIIPQHLLQEYHNVSLMTYSHL